MTEEYMIEQDEVTSLNDADVFLTTINISTIPVSRIISWGSIKTLISSLVGIASAIHAAIGKTTPHDNDELGIVDTEASNVLKKLTWANLKATLKTYFDTLYGTVTLTGTQTLTNKRVTPRTSTEVSSATPTINTDNVDAHSITALAAAITSMTTNLSGTPTNFQKLIIRIKDDGTARAITWGASFEAKGADLPTSTTASKLLTIGFIYDTVTSKWGCVAVSKEA